jgi:cytochrome c oxidase subunit 4
MSSHNSNDDGHDDDHGGNFKYFVIFITLVILTSMSFFTESSYWPKALDNHAVKWTFMMAVSCTKAMLVILFFMHLKWEANWKYALTIPASFMSLFLLLMLVPDVGLRMKNASRERRLHMAVPQAADHGANLSSSHDGSDASHDEQAPATDHGESPNEKSFNESAAADSADDHSSENPRAEEPNANDHTDAPSAE